MYSFGLWCLSLGTAFLLFGNFNLFGGKTDAPGTLTQAELKAKTEARDKSYKTSKRWVVFILLQMMIIAPAGMYLNNNSLAIDAADDGVEDTAEFVNKRYQQKRNTLMYFKYVLAFGMLLGTQLYKTTSTNSIGRRRVLQSPLDPTKEVIGYEQMSVHFQQRTGHYFGYQDLMALVTLLYVVAEFCAMFLVVTHQTLFSNKGLASTYQWWEMSVAVCGLLCVVLFFFMWSVYYGKSSQRVFYNPEAAVGHDHPAEDASIWNLELTIPTLRTMMVKVPSLLVLVFSATEMLFSVIFNVDYGAAWVFILIVVLLPHMFTAMLRTHAAWFQYHLWGMISYGSAFFLMPALNESYRTNLVGSDNNFIPNSADPDRHLMLPQEFANTDHMFRNVTNGNSFLFGNTWTALYQISLALAVIALSTAFVGQGLMVMFTGKAGGVAQVPSVAEFHYFGHITGHRNGFFDMLIHRRTGEVKGEA
jgi:hypothetical protein